MNFSYLIWSHEHAAWWGPMERGYMKDANEAGRYPRAVAIRICMNALRGSRDGVPNEILVREQDLIDTGITKKGRT